nr:uncharacterized protein LOC109787267 [Aegilops tauschii subsp. strangulata]
MQQGQQLQPPPPATAALGIPTTGPGVHIHQVQFPPSLSPLPAWLARSLEPVYTTASVGPHVLPPPAAHPAMKFGGSSGYAEPFASVDGPLGQRTLASDRTWIASYHLRGAAQTWYYALEQDEGNMPPLERFRDSCLLRFGPPIRGSRLAELGRLPFLTSVQEFVDRFQALACHAPGVSARQRAELFVGGLPDHIRVDVEMRGEHDL